MDKGMLETERANALQKAVAAYFDLMYDYDVSRFDQVFTSCAQLHGLRDGNLKLITATHFVARYGLVNFGLPRDLFS